MHHSGWFICVTATVSQSVGSVAEQAVNRNCQKNGELSAAYEFQY